MRCAGAISRTTLVRPAVWDTLDGLVRPGMLVGVVGPSGSGKTTTVRGWSQRASAASATWRSADAADLFDVLASPDTVVIDDVPAGTEREGLAEALAGRVDRGASTLLLSRGEPLRDWQYRRGQGTAVTLGFEDFLLDLDEARELLEQRGVSPTTDQVIELHRLTCGWPTLLGLLAAGLAPAADPAMPIVTVDAESYLRAEILARLPAAHRSFLARLALLGTWDSHLAEVALDDPAAASRLDDLWRDRTLVLPVPDRPGHFHLPPLVERLLHSDPSRPSKEERVALHQTASLELERRGEWDRAIAQMLASSEEQAVRQLIRMVAAQEPYGRNDVALHWFQRLPRSARIQPTSVLGLVKALLQAGFPTEAYELLDRAAQDHWERRDHIAEYLVLRAITLRILFRHQEAVSSASAALAMVEDGLDCSPERVAYLRLFATDQIAEVRAWEGDLDAVDRLRSETAPDTTTSGEHLNLLHSIGLAALVSLDRGEISEAEARAESLLRMAERRSFGDSHVTSEAHLVLGLVAAERDNLDRALNHLDTGLALARKGLFPTTVVRLELALAQVLTRAGRVPEAQRYADSVAELARGTDDEPLRARAAAAAGALNLPRRDSSQVAAAARRLQGLIGPPDVLRIRILMSLRLESHPDLEALVHALASSPSVRDQVVVLFARAHQQHSQDPAAAAACLAEALRSAEPAGLWRTVLEVGDGLAELGTDALALADPASGPTAAYVRRVVGELSAMALRRRSLLSPREAEVAKYLGTRLTNSQIAAQLFISENTAKTHVRHIYQKLGVENRDEAVPVLYELGYIPLEG